MCWENAKSAMLMGMGMGMGGEYTHALIGFHQNPIPITMHGCMTLCAIDDV